MSAERAIDRQRIRNLVDIGRYDEARAALVGAIASDPDDAELHGLIALADRDNGVEADLGRKADPLLDRVDRAACDAGIGEDAEPLRARAPRE